MSSLLPRQLLWDPQAAEAARHWNSNPQRCKFPAVHAEAHQVLQWHAKRPSSACWRRRWRPGHGNEQHFHRFVRSILQCVLFSLSVCVCACVFHFAPMLGFCQLHHAFVMMSSYLPMLPPACQEGETHLFVWFVLTVLCWSYDTWANSPDFECSTFIRRSFRDQTFFCGRFLLKFTCCCGSMLSLCRCQAARALN